MLDINWYGLAISVTYPSGEEGGILLVQMMFQPSRPRSFLLYYLIMTFLLATMKLLTNKKNSSVTIFKSVWSCCFDPKRLQKAFQQKNQAESRLDMYLLANFFSIERRTLEKNGQWKRSKLWWVLMSAISEFRGKIVEASQSFVHVNITIIISQ